MCIFQQNYQCSKIDDVEPIKIDSSLLVNEESPTSSGKPCPQVRKEKIPVVTTVEIPTHA